MNAENMPETSFHRGKMYYGGTGVHMKKISQRKAELNINLEIIKKKQSSKRYAKLKYKNFSIIKSLRKGRLKNTIQFSACNYVQENIMH